MRLQSKSPQSTNDVHRGSVRGRANAIEVYRNMHPESLLLVEPICANFAWNSPLCPKITIFTGRSDFDKTIDIRYGTISKIKGQLYPFRSSIFTKRLSLVFYRF